MFFFALTLSKIEALTLKCDTVVQHGHADMARLSEEMVLNDPNKAEGANNLILVKIE